MTDSKEVATRVKVGTVVPIEDVSAIMARYIEQYAGMEQDAILAITAQLLSAEIPMDLNAPWDDEVAKVPFNVPLRIERFKVLPSDFEGGWGHFLYVDAFRLDTGEEIHFTSGAQMVAVQLFIAADRGMLPVIAEVIEMPTRKKDRQPPQRLNVIRSEVVENSRA